MTREQTIAETFTAEEREHIKRLAKNAARDLGFPDEELLIEAMLIGASYGAKVVREQQQAETLAPSSAWQPIETADGTRVIVFDPDRGVCVAHRDSVYDWLVYPEELGCSPTHWQPLPPGPPEPRAPQETP